MGDFVYKIIHKSLIMYTESSISLGTHELQDVT